MNIKIEFNGYKNLLIHMNFMILIVMKIQRNNFQMDIILLKLL